MLGWSIIARAWRSASKRATTCFVSMPGLMTFRATLRRTGCDLLGDVDDAHAPLADLLPQLVGADDRAGAFGDRAAARPRSRRGRGRRLRGSLALAVGPEQGARRGRRRRVIAPADAVEVGRALAPATSSSRAARKIASVVGLSTAFIDRPPRTQVRRSTGQCETGAGYPRHPGIFSSSGSSAGRLVAAPWRSRSQARA